MTLTAVNVAEYWDPAGLTAGVEINARGNLALIKQLTLDEDFSEDTLDPEKWGSIIAGSGSIVPNGPAAPYIEQKKPTGASLATLYLKDTIDESNPFRLRLAFSVSNYSSVGFIWMLSGYAAAPTSNDIGTNQIFMLRRSASLVDITYKDSGDAAQYWNGSSWQSGQTAFALAERAWRFAYLISDGTSWKIRFEAADGSLVTETTSITWANTRPLGGSESAYLVTHDNRISTPAFTFKLSSVEIWPTEEATTYLTSAQSCPTEAIQTTEAFDSGDVMFMTGREIVAGAEVRLTVNVDGAGFGAPINVNTVPVAGLTGVYQFTAGTAFAPTANVILKIEINSPSGSTQIELSLPWIDGVTSSEVAGVTYQLPLEAVELAELEVVEL